MFENRFKSLTIPRFSLPAFVATVGNKLPQWPHALALTAGLNAVVKMKLLAEDSLNLLEGRTFLIDVLDTGGRAAFTFRNGLFRPLFSAPETPDLAFRANLSAFLQLAARQEDPDTLFFNRELSIEGDTELGLIVKNMLDAMEWPSFPGMPAFRH
ncbi:SCP2 sterol-binding domain-containing protein [uncultured Propionivibrio sp.]|uniref:ubiquinone anaerobic biosynthesis accessory factor UbiT n=1 Tax=uncultured Propionivibrio sp. TaxID=426737 RepID=UPI0029BFE3C1|nr:SCP2 sterol-binding domain-containing protein [uncultured Propionivibrio sp.]